MRIILFILVLPITLFAQRLQPGFVIQTSGDTLNGYIEYRLSGHVVSSCKFASSPKGGVKTLLAADIIGFGFNGDKFFISHQFEGDQSFVFVEKLIHGPVSLYRYGNAFFIEKDKWYPLEEEKVIINQVYSSHELNKKKYTGILNYLFLDCPRVAKKTQNVRLAEADLVRITKEYNACSGHNSVDFKENKPSFVANFMAGIGGASSVLQYTTLGQKFKLDGIAPTIMVGVQFSNPRMIENLFTSLQLAYIPHTYAYSYQKNNGSYVDNGSVEIKYSRITLPLGFKYVIGSRSISPYIGGGYCFNTFFNGRYEKQSTWHLNSGEKLDFSINEDIGNLSVNQFWLSLGVQKQMRGIKTFVEIRSEGIVQKSNTIVYNKEETRIIMDEKSMRNSTLRLLFGVVF